MRRLLCGCVVLAGLALAPAASAAVSLGHTAPSGTAIDACGACSDFQLHTDGASPSYAVPSGDAGVITGWSTTAPPVGCGCGPTTVRLRVFRATSTSGTYLVVGDSVDETLPSDGQVHSFPTDIDVQPGDMIGIRFTNGVSGVASSHSDDTEAEVLGDPSPGGTDPEASIGSYLVNVAATLQPDTPVAAFGYTIDPGVGVADAFNGSFSSSGATITDYSWNFGDGTTFDGHSAPTASHVFSAPGNYNVTLTITDSLGFTATITHTVEAPLLTFRGLVFSETPVPAVTALQETAGGKVALSVTCDQADISCDTHAALYGVSGKLPARASTVRGPAAKLLGKASFTLATGSTTDEILTLDKAGRALLAKRHHFKARLLLTATDRLHRVVTKRYTVTIS